MGWRKAAVAQNKPEERSLTWLGHASTWNVGHRRAGVAFQHMPWRSTGTSILKGLDDIQQLLDDQAVKIQVHIGQANTTEIMFVYL